MEATDNTFIKQSLSDTLLKNGSTQRPKDNQSLSRPRRLLNIKEMTSRRAKADEDTGGILKTLGLTPTSRRISDQSMIDNEDVNDWEQVGSDGDSDHKNQSNGTCLTPKAKPLPTGPEEFLKQMPLASKHLPGETTDLFRRGSTKSLDTESLASLRRKLADSEKTKEDLLAKVKRLERELNEAKGQKLRPDGKTLAAREYEELEKQFDAQEKLLCGYQRENERSLIELEAVKVRALKMSNFLNKVYGPDWEETIGLNDAASTAPPHHNPSHNSSITSTALPATPAEKFAAQLVQVQLLVQGMERRLVTREVELEALHRQAKEDGDALHRTITKVDTMN